MRVFLDTNVLVSAVASRGLCADVLREILISHELVVSEPLISELSRVLRSKIGVPEDIIDDYIVLLTRDAVKAEDAPLPKIDVSDADDIRILSTALNGNAALFVTGDKALLELRKIESMRIISPRQFWETITT